MQLAPGEKNAAMFVIFLRQSSLTLSNEMHLSLRIRMKLECITHVYVGLHSH